MKRVTGRSAREKKRGNERKRETVDDSPVSDEHFRPPHQLHANSRTQFLHPPRVNPEIALKVDAFPASSSFRFCSVRRDATRETRSALRPSTVSELRCYTTRNSPAFSNASFHLFLSLHPASAIPPTNSDLNLGCSLLSRPDRARTLSMLGAQ